jgi:hypothetical protein
MDMTTMRMLVSILKESQLYMTMTHEERIALLFRLLKEYPSLGNPQNLKPNSSPSIALADL